MDAGAQKQVNERLTDTASTRPLFTRADRDAYEFVEYATDGKTLLTIKESDLKRYGFADPNTTIRSDGDLQQYFGAAHVRRLDQTWSEDLVAFMTQGISGQVVKGLLIIVFLMAMFIEMSMPGVGLPGVIALVALAGLVVPPMLIGAANWWMGALIVGGLLLLLLEVFVLPGFGVPGIIGLVMLFAGLVGTFAAPGQLFPGVGSGGMGELARAGSIVLLSLFIAGVGLFFFVKYTHRFPVVGKLVLAHQQSASTDADAGMLAAMASEAPSKGPVARGAVGRATTPLRPSGTAEFDDRLVDVVAEFGFIDAGRRVRVTSVTEYRVAVEEIREA
jgi:membrane-bound serine protease (ClpP class)